MIYLLFLLVGLAAVAYVGAPFMTRRAAHEYSSGAPEDVHELSSDHNLRERRDSLLRQLKELEFDRSMGKTEEEEYALLRAELSHETAGVLQQLEHEEPAIQSSSSHLSTHVENEPSGLVWDEAADLDLEIEVLVARARRKRRVAVSTVNGASVNGAVVNGVVVDAEAFFCTACGWRMNSDHCFCARCGQPRDASVVA